MRTFLLFASNWNQLFFFLHANDLTFILSLSLFNCAAADVADSKFIEHHIRNQKSKKTIYVILYVLYLIACVRACMLSFVLLIFTYAQFKFNMCSFSWFACKIWFILDWFCRNSTRKRKDICFYTIFCHRFDMRFTVVVVDGLKLSISLHISGKYECVERWETQRLNEWITQIKWQKWKKSSMHFEPSENRHLKLIFFVFNSSFLFINIYTKFAFLKFLSDLRWDSLMGKESTHRILSCLIKLVFVLFLCSIFFLYICVHVSVIVMCLLITFDFVVSAVWNDKQHHQY